MTRTRPSSWPPPGPAATRAIGWWSSCWPAPACASVSWSTSRPTRWQIGANHWLRIPLGKLRNDRYVPLHPRLVELLGDWTATNLEHIRAHRRLVADRRGSVNRHSISRIIHRIGRVAGVPGVHPHRLRHIVGGAVRRSAFGR
jgi:integrase